MELEVDVANESDVALLVSRVGHALANLEPEERARLMTVCSELGRNIVKYGVHGFVRVRVEATTLGTLVSIDAVDRGPGIADVDAALRDHVSTGGTLGLGLPGARRMMDAFSVDSRPGRGTHVHAERLVTQRGQR